MHAILALHQIHALLVRTYRNGSNKFLRLAKQIEINIQDHR
jgi:hypothetical protein